MIRIKEIDDFKKAIEQVALFIDSCNIHFNDEGLHINAFDAAQMLYLQYSLEKEGFEGKESGLIGINVVELNKILQKVNQDEFVYLIPNINYLEVKIEGSYSRSYFLSLKDVDEKELNINLDDYPVVFKLSAKLIKDIFSSARIVSDAIIFECHPTNLVIKAEGLLGKYQTKLNIETLNDFQTKFSVIHLLNMLKNVELDSNVEIRLSQQQPLFLTYKIGKNTLKYFLAHMFV